MSPRRPDPRSAESIPHDRCAQGRKESIGNRAEIEDALDLRCELIDLIPGDPVALRDHRPAQRESKKNSSNAYYLQISAAFPFCHPVDSFGH